MSDDTPELVPDSLMTEKVHITPPKGQVTIQTSEIRTTGGSRWKMDKELVLAKGYIKFSMDPKVVTDQESEKLWGYISEYFKGQMNEVYIFQ
jgi:hypothetical protein